LRRGTTREVRANQVNRRLTVHFGEIVAAVSVGQSTVSAHLKVLAEVGFVLAEHRGTASCRQISGRS
jgi:DNA-binding transcriptional ArsR family regulator